MSISLSNIKRTLKPYFRKSSASHLKVLPDGLNSPYSYIPPKDLLKPKKSETSNSRLKILNKNSTFVNHNRVKSSKLLNFITGKKKSHDEKLEFKLISRLKNADPSLNFEVFEQAFDEVIRSNKSLTKVLELVKSGYEQKIGYFSVKNFDELLAQVKELKEKCLEEFDEKNKLKRELEASVAENAELSRNLDMTESLYLEVHEKWQKIVNWDMGDIQINENMWKVVLHENKALKKEVTFLKQRVDELTAKEKGYLKIISQVKECSGVGKQLNDMMHDFNSKSTGIVIGSDSCDSENLVSSRIKEVKKPLNIPDLNFDLLTSEESSFKDSEDSDDY